MIEDPSPSVAGYDFLDNTANGAEANDTAKDAAPPVPAPEAMEHIPQVHVVGKRIKPGASQRSEPARMSAPRPAKAHDPAPKNTAKPETSTSAPPAKRRSQAKNKIDLSNPLLNAGFTNGLVRLRKLSAAEVYKLRNSGTPIPKKTYTKTDRIEELAGFDRARFSALGPQQISANLDLLQARVTTAADANKVPKDLINAIITLESKGMQNAVSGTGALGSSQMTYSLYASDSAAAAYGGKINPFDAGQAIDRQAKHLAHLLKVYKGDVDKVVAAYNQGEGVVNSAIMDYGKEWASQIPAEGKNYIVKIREILAGSKGIPGYFKTPRK
jgi:soluble lytic murein transglycosylase-like protein